MPGKITSQNKLDFIEKSIEIETETLSSAQLADLAGHYKDKRGINLVVAGDTDKGKEILKRKLDADIGKYEAPEIKYAYFLLDIIRYKELCLDYFESSDWSLLGILGDENFYNDLSVKLNRIFGEKKPALEQLSSEDLYNLNKIFEEFTDPYRQAIDRGIKKIIEFKKLTFALTSDDIQEEVETLQKTLPENETVGLITVFSKLSSKHTEALIITRDKIIKPLSWPSARLIIDTNSWDSVYSLEMKYLIENFQEAQPLNIQAQADKGSCANLSLMYLKELLKNNAEQLIDYSLCIEFYDSSNKKNRLFIPSPHVLRYSQLSIYNKIIEASLADELDLQKIIYKDKTLHIKPLKRILHDSIEIAKNKGEKVLAEENQKQLDELSDFRERWSREYTQVCEKRAALKINENGNKDYLTYSNVRSSRTLKNKEIKIDANEIIEKVVSSAKSYNILSTKDAETLINRCISKLKEEDISEELKLVLVKIILSSPHFNKLGLSIESENIQGESKVPLDIINNRLSTFKAINAPALNELITYLNEIDKRIEKGNYFKYGFFSALFGGFSALQKREAAWELLLSYGSKDNVKCLADKYHEDAASEGKLSSIRKKM